MRLIFYFLAVFSLHTAFAQHTHFLLRDEGLSQLSYIDLTDSAHNWYVPVPAGRDMQLIGQGRVLIGTDNGYEEREISTGKKLYEMSGFPGTIAARRLANGNTMLTGVNWQGKQGIVLAEVNANASLQRIISYPGFTYARLLRETTAGTFLITANDTVFEGDSHGNIIWQAVIDGKKQSHAWQAVRLSGGRTIVSGGYAASLQLFDNKGALLKTITGPENVKPHFFAGLQVMPDGNYLVINWEGHGKGHGATGTQLLEYTPEGKLAWSWTQDPAHFSSLHAVIMLDGLDTNNACTEDGNGVLKPVKVLRSGLE